MKTIFVLTALLITCFGEEYPEETADVFKSKLWKEVIKRLHDAKESEHGGDPESGGLSGLKLNDDLNDRPQYEADASPKCPKGSPNALDSISANTIIKTKDSVMSGATFLSSPRISSAAECLNLCCQKSRCTLAVYENKKKNACYLFDCGVPSRCQFTEHANYTSLTLKKAPPVVEEHVMTTPPSVKENDNHEDELQGLLKPETAKPTEFQPPKTTQQATTQAPALPPTTTVKKIVQVKLFASCSETEVCEEENAECKEQFCVCKEGFRPKNGRCVLPEEPVSHCGRFQFECKSPNGYPKCIASYDRCDGVSQCPDGSDEADCSSAYAQDYTNNQQQLQQLDDSSQGHQRPEDRQEFNSRKRPGTLPPVHQQPVQNPQEEQRQPHVGPGRGTDVESQLPNQRQPVQPPSRGDVPSGRRPTGRLDVGTPQETFASHHPRVPNRGDSLNRKRPDLNDPRPGVQQLTDARPESVHPNIAAPQTQDRRPPPDQTRPNYNDRQMQGQNSQGRQGNRPGGNNPSLNRKRPDLNEPRRPYGQGQGNVQIQGPDIGRGDHQSIGRPDGHLDVQLPPDRDQTPQQLPPDRSRIRPGDVGVQDTLHTGSQQGYDPSYQGQPYDKDNGYQNPNPYPDVGSQYRPGQQGTYNSQYNYNSGSAYPQPEYELGYHPAPDYKPKPNPSGHYNQYYNQYDTSKDAPYDKDRPFINNYENPGSQSKYPTNVQGQQPQNTYDSRGRYPDYYESTGYTDINSNPYPDLSAPSMYNNYHYNEG